MGGGGGSAAAITEVQKDPEFTGQMRTFGAGQPDLVQQQLNMAGLGGMIDPTQFQSTQMPILKNPAEIELYLKSIGKTPSTFDNSTSSSSSSGANTNGINIGL